MQAGVARLVCRCSSPFARGGFHPGSRSNDLRLTNALIQGMEAAMRLTRPPADDGGGDHPNLRRLSWKRWLIVSFGLAHRRLS